MEKRKGIKSGFGVARIANGDQAVLLLCITKIGNVHHIGRALQQLHIAVHTRKHKAQYIRNGIRRAVSDHIDLFGLAQQVGRTVDRLQGLRLAQRFQQAHVFGYCGNHTVFGGLGLLFAVNAEQVFVSASVIKIPLLALALRDVQQGRLDWNAPREIDPRNRVSGTGILCELSRDYHPSLSEMATLMIVLSDNIATNEIIDMVGMDRFAQFCEEMQLPHTKLMRKMLDFEAIAKGLNNYTSAGDMGRLLVRIAKGEFVNAEVSQTILRIMEHQQCRNKLPAALPTVPNYASEEDKKRMQEGTVLVANKTGELVGLQHDVGVFTLPDGRRYVIAALTADLEDDQQGVQIISQLSRVIYDAMK